MIKFERVARCADAALPVRSTAHSAGYDFYVAEDTVIPSYSKNFDKMMKYTWNNRVDEPITVEEISSITSKTKAKPTLVSTGVKCYLDEGTYLELSVRSSTPLKNWILLANGVGRL